mgnify:CR=1 FL=1
MNINCNSKALIPDTAQLTGMITEYEGGSASADSVLELFSVLIQTGLVWSLQGSYGRTARHLIDQGSLSEDGTITHEFLPF